MDTLGTRPTDSKNERNDMLAVLWVLLSELCQIPSRLGGSSLKQIHAHRQKNEQRDEVIGHQHDSKPFNQLKKVVGRCDVHKKTSLWYKVLCLARLAKIRQ